MHWQKRHMMAGTAHNSRRYWSNRNGEEADMGDDFYNPMTIEGGLLYDDVYGGLLGGILDDEESQERKTRRNNDKFGGRFYDDDNGDFGDELDDDSFDDDDFDDDDDLDDDDDFDDDDA